MFTRILIALLAITLPLQALAQDTERALPESRTEMQLSFSPLVKKIAPAVVNIYTKRVVTRSYHPFMNDPMFAPFFENQQFGGSMKKQVEGALASGVIIDSSVLIVTNSHGGREAQEITVVLNDGRGFG